MSADTSSWRSTSARWYTPLRPRPISHAIRRPAYPPALPARLIRIEAARLCHAPRQPARGCGRPRRCFVVVRGGKRRRAALPRRPLRDRHAPIPPHPCCAQRVVCAWGGRPHEAVLPPNAHQHRRRLQPRLLVLDAHNRHQRPQVPFARCRGVHPLNGCPRDVARRVKVALLRPPYLPSAQQQVVGEERSCPFDQPPRRATVEPSRRELREVSGAECAAQLTQARRAVRTPHLLNRERHQRRRPRLHHHPPRLPRPEGPDGRLVRPDGGCLQPLAGVLRLPRAPLTHVFEQHQHRRLVVRVAARFRRVEERLSARPLDEVRPQLQRRREMAVVVRLVHARPVGLPQLLEAFHLPCRRPPPLHPHVPCAGAQRPRQSQLRRTRGDARR
eukprot:5473678-Pleurochrysis_carterae.AAC.1